MNRLTVEIPGLPIPQGSKRVYGGRVVDSNADQLRPYRASVLAAVAGAMPDGWSAGGHFHVDLLFLFPRPRSHYRADGQLRESAFTAAKITRPDLDKLCRAVLDACTDALVWGDDAQVTRLIATKRYLLEGGPRTLLEIRRHDNH
jgi:crossover junction endodeoxyribonuclease RusA